MYFEEGVHLETNDLYVILQMGSMTGFYSVFRLNVNLFLDYPMDESSPLFANAKKPVRSDLKKEVKQILPKQVALEPKDAEEEKVIDEKEEIKKKSILKFKRSKSRHIINQYGQIVGMEPMTDEEKKKNNEKIRMNSKIKKVKINAPEKKRPKTKSVRKKADSYNIFAPGDSSSEDDYETLYGTERTFEVKHVSHPALSVEPLKKTPKLSKKIKKTTMRLSFPRHELDKAYYKLPKDFEIVFHFRCLEEKAEWVQEWEELENLRNEVIAKIEKSPDAGRIMINGNL